MKKPTYVELLKDPRWQKKRLEVLNSNGWACEECSDSQSELHVHHGVYIPDNPPWDYPDSLFHCLCKNCHSESHLVLKTVKMLLGKLSPSQLWGILKLLDSLMGRSHHELGISMGIIGDEILDSHKSQLRKTRK